MHFLKKNFLLLACWLLAALLLGAVGWVTLLTQLAKEKQQAEAAAMKEAEIFARAYANHLFRALEAVDQITRYVKYGWESSNGNFKLEQVSQSGLFPVSSGFYVSVIDQHGNLLTSTIPSAHRVNIRREPYFTVHRSTTDLFYIGIARIGNFSKTPVVPFSRRLSAPDGRFQGIVLVSVVPEYFMSSYDEVSLKQNGFLGILGTDHVVRLARMGQKVFLPGRDVESLVRMPPLKEPSGSVLADGAQWFIDQRSRYVAWQTTVGFEMVAVAGLDQQDALAPYREMRRSAIKTALLASLGLAVLTLAALFLSLRLAWRKHQFDAMQATCRTATEGSHEGFFIVRPLRDKEEKIIDFKIVDCNEQGAYFLRYRREELVGRRVLDIYQGEAADRTLRMLCKAMKTRYYEGEIELASLELKGPTWLHIRIVRPNGDLAVTMRDISNIKAHLAELERRGNEDALTGLPNRHWVNAYLPQSVVNAGSAHRMMALLFIDLDGFKAVNDTAGHEAGDDILRAVGKRLKEAVRPHDYVVRIGGDEFLVILEKIGQVSDAAHVAERVLDAFRPAFKIVQGTHAIGASIGISVFPQDGTNANTLLNNADVAMYSVKSCGKNNYRFFDPAFSEILRSRHQKEAELRNALEQDQLMMHYQPRVDVSTGITSSMEALVRWVHPTRGLIEPNEFIPLAEETGLIVPLGRQVIHKVCAQLALWAEQVHDLVPVSINVSARQFHESDIPGLLSSCMAQYQIAPHLIEIELTESTMIDDTSDMAQTLASIQRMGIKLLVDDFGTGYSSLSQLQRLDFDVLKVDRAFTADLEKSNESVVLITAIITMAHALGMRVVAEGVESLSQIKTLKALRCDEVQGFFISKPLPPTETQPILPRWFFPSTA